MRLRRLAVCTPRPYFERARCPTSHIHRPTRDRAHRRQSEHAHRVGLSRVEYRSEQHDGRAGQNQTQSSHLNQSPDYHDSLAPLSRSAEERAPIVPSTRHDAGVGKTHDYGLDFECRAVSRMRLLHANLCETRIRRETGRIAIKSRTPAPRTCLYAAASTLLRDRGQSHPARSAMSECMSER